MKEIPSKGWYITKANDSSDVNNVRVYLDGKILGGIRNLSIKLDGEELFPIIELEIIPTNGLKVDTSFGKMFDQPDVEMFRSTKAPEEVLKATEKECEPPKTEIL